MAAQVLMNLGLKLEEVREEVLNLLGAGVENEEAPAQEKPGNFIFDLNAPTYIREIFKNEPNVFEVERAYKEFYNNKVISYK